MRAGRGRWSTLAAISCACARNEAWRWSRMRLILVISFHVGEVTQRWKKFLLRWVLS